MCAAFECYVYSVQTFLQFSVCCGYFSCIDHATELRNARARIRDLEVAASSQRAEVAKCWKFLLKIMVVAAVCLSSVIACFCLSVKTASLLSNDLYPMSVSRLLMWKLSFLHIFGYCCRNKICRTVSKTLHYYEPILSFIVQSKSKQKLSIRNRDVNWVPRTRVLEKNPETGKFITRTYSRTTNQMDFRGQLASHSV